MDLMGPLTGRKAAAVVAGDVRANENTGLTAIQTLFAREHNRIVAKLDANPLTAGFSNQMKFDIARRVVGAEQQYITYNEFLPAMGVDLPKYPGYQVGVDPSISNEFATVGFRAHSQIHGTMEPLAPLGTYTQAQLDAFAAKGMTQEPDTTQIHLVIPLSLAFGNPSLLRDVGVGPLLVMGAVTGILIYRAFGNTKGFESAFGFVITAKARPHALIAAAAVIITACSYFAVNYAKFHTFDGVPLKYYDFYVQNPSCLEMSGGRQLHLENIPTTLVSYLGLHGLWLGPKFPWLFPSREATFIGSPAILNVEGFSTFPVSMPALLVLAMLGCLPLVRGDNEMVRRLRLPVSALLLGASIVLATLALTERYLHEFYPVLIICAAVGISRLQKEKYFCAGTIIVAALTLVSIAVNCSFALENQRLDAWSVGGVPEAKKAEFKKLQRSIYLFFHPAWRQQSGRDQRSRLQSSGTPSL